MKRLIAVAMMALGAGQIMADATPLLTVQQSQILRLPDLDDRMMNDFFDGNMSGTIVECPEGVSMPFKFDLKGEFFFLESGPTPYLKLLKTCYVQCVAKKNFLFSTDLQTWKEFSEFFTGAITVSLDTEQDEPVAGLQIELNHRQG